MVKKVKGHFERSIVVGSISHWLGKKADGHTHTHRWTAYLRGMNNEDLHFIKKVVFHLHASFKNPHRAVETPPYEISETGWGEFDLGVTIHFVDPNEKPLDLFHLLRLHPPDGIKTKQPVVSETLDIVMFHDPTESFYNLVKLPDKPPEATNPSLKLTDQISIINGFVVKTFGKEWIESITQIDIDYKELNVFATTVTIAQVVFVVFALCFVNQEKGIKKAQERDYGSTKRTRRR
eukprot:gene16842-20026_t